jgi:NADPH:quinone reductase-like Zn-dependent oxidoreductase
MRRLAIFGGLGGGGCLERVTVDGVSLGCAVVQGREPDFAGAPGTVLVRVLAVSCNFRDRSLFQRMTAFPAHRFTAIGSEFAAEVLAVAEGVSLRPGDRVIPDHHYSGVGIDADGVREGVITNQGSRERQVVPARKLLRVPDTMPLDIAAAFSLGAQTAYSMVRRLDVQPGERALVTSASSNTSLFLIAALRARGAQVLATTGAGPAARARIPARVAAREDLYDLAGEVGGFHHVLDPFYDLHLGAAVDVLRPFGKYITCGFYGQNPTLAGGVAPLDPQHVFGNAIVKNLSLIGNCIGLRSDLEAALADHAAGVWSPVVDSVHREARPFLERTFNARERFGKVVFRYDA